MGDFTGKLFNVYAEMYFFLFSLMQDTQQVEVSSHLVKWSLFIFILPTVWTLLLKAAGMDSQHLPIYLKLVEWTIWAVVITGVLPAIVILCVVVKDWASHLPAGQLAFFVVIPLLLFFVVKMLGK